MADETITRHVSERYAGALATGEQMCCPTRYNFEDLPRFAPEEVLGAFYGSGTPAGVATPRPGETVLDIGSRRFAVINRAGEPVAGEAVACVLGGSCC